MRPLFLFALLATSAAAQPRLDAGRDPLTGEPVVFADAAPNAEAPPEQGGSIPLAHHAASGATKLVRHGIDGLTMYHDGADLVLGGVAFPVRGPLDDPAFAESDRYRLPALPSDAAVVGSRVYVALRKNQGILILETATGVWTLAGQISGPDALAVAVDGTTVYVGRGSAGVSVYDASNPQAPVLLGTVDTPGSANGLALQGSLLAVADGNVAAGPDVRLYDVSTPGTFTPLGTAEMDGFATYAAFHAGRLYVTGDAGLRAFDVSNPASPVVLGTASAGGETTYEVVFFDGTTAYVAGLAGLRVVDVSEPAPVETGAWDGGGQYLSVADPVGSTGFVPVADRFGGLQFVNVNGTPTTSTLVPNGGFPYRGVFAGGRLYVTSLGGGLRILSADGVTELGRVPTPPNTQEVLVIGTRAYVTDANGDASGLTVIETSNPAAPVVLGTYPVGTSYGMATDAEARTLFVASGFGGLRSYDLAGATPVLLDTYDVGANAVDVASDNDGGFGYVVSFGGGMTVLYIADPADLSLLDAEPGWGFLQAVEIDPSPINRARVFAADGSAGLRLVDATNAAGITTVSTTPTISPARDVAARDVAGFDPLHTNVYVAEDFAGMRRFQVSAYDNGPVTVTGSFTSMDRGIGVAVEPGAPDADRRVALMAGEAGVYVFDDLVTSAADAPVALALAVESVGPNPATATATVRYRLAGAGEATVEVLDLLGRRVAVTAGASTPGAHAATVDVRALAAGLYVVRVAQNGTAVTTRLAVAR